jgi:hypothetical protein
MTTVPCSYRENQTFDASSISLPSSLIAIESPPYCDGGQGKVNSQLSDD